MLKTLPLLILAAIVMASVACSSKGYDGSDLNLEENNGDVFKTFNVAVHPEGTGTILLNPAPIQSNRYKKGDHVSITVVPKPGWQVRKWIGPSDLSSNGNDSELEITKSSNVVAIMSRLDGSDATVAPYELDSGSMSEKPDAIFFNDRTPTPTATPGDVIESPKSSNMPATKAARPTASPTSVPTPTPPAKRSVTTPVFEKIDLGGDTIWLEPAGCNNEYFERVTLQEGDRVDLSVTAARMVTIVVKSPHAGRKTVGKSDKFHEISYQAMSGGTHILIIVADYAQQAYLQCNKRASQVEYEYTVYRPTTN